MEMEGLLLPCQRLSGLVPVGFREHELAVSPLMWLKEPLLIDSYAPFIHSLGSSVVWLSKNIFIVDRKSDRQLSAQPEFRRSSYVQQLSLSFRPRHAASSGTFVVWQSATSIEQIEAPTELCQVTDHLLNLLACWECPVIRLQIHRGDGQFHVSPNSLTNFVSATHFRELELINVDLDASQCRILGHVRGKPWKLTLWDVTMRDAASFNAGLSENSGPTKLEIWTMQKSSGLDLLESFTENTRLKHLVAGGSACLQSDSIGKVVYALSMNEGLEKLCLSCSISSRAWQLLWKAVEQHPTIRHVDIRNSSADTDTWCISEYTMAVADCTKTNQTLQKIDLSPRLRNDFVWKQLVQPALEVNTYRFRLDSIFRIEDHDIRDKLLVKALASMSDKPHLLFLATQLGMASKML